MLLLGAVVALLIPLGVWTVRAATDIPADADVYVSIGDSYAAGFRPTDDGGTATTREGFAYLVADRSAAAGRPLALLNFACTGATSTDVLHRDGCEHWALGPGAPRYDDEPQADAALAALRERAEHVRLVTIVIGGNDVNACLPPNHDALPPEAQACLDNVFETLDGNLRTLLGRIREAVGPDVPVVGITYPDIFLGGYTFGDAPSRSFADASVEMFREGLNPTLRNAYTAAGASFLDLTQLTGAYDPLDRTVDQPPYGVVPNRSRGSAR